MYEHLGIGKLTFAVTHGYYTLHNHVRTSWHRETDVCFGISWVRKTDVSYRAIMSGHPGIGKLTFAPPDIILRAIMYEHPDRRKIDVVTSPNIILWEIM